MKSTPLPDAAAALPRLDTPSLMEGPGPEGKGAPKWHGSFAVVACASIRGGRFLLRALAYGYGILLILLLVWQCAFVNWPMPNGDVELYHKYASAFWSDAHRFQSLPAEYPPLASFVFSLTLLPELPRVPPLAGMGQAGEPITVLSRDAGFAVWMGLFVLLTFLLCWRLSTQKRAWACLAYLCIGAVGVLLTRFDLVPSFAVLLAVAAARRRRFPLSYLLLALGTALKLYPIFLIPVFAAYQWRVLRGTVTRAPEAGDDAGARAARAGPPQSATRALASIALSLGAFAAFIAGNILLANAWDPRHGALDFLNYSSTRPLQVESFPATLLWLAGAFGLPVSAQFSYFSFNLVGPADGVLILLSYAGLVLGCTVTYWRVLVGKLSFGRGTVAVVAIVILTGKVFSTQYVIWLLPLVALVEGFDWLWLAICLLTAWDYPILYHAFAPTMMRQYDPLLLGVIAARNILLLVATIRLFYRARPRRPYRQRARGRASAAPPRVTVPPVFS